MYIERILEKKILEASKKYPVIMLTGQRQVGKSTMLYHIREEERNYISLDDINARRLAESDPKLFFETYKAPLIIDEFQRVPELTIEIKRIVDELSLKGESNEGMYWLTGSQRFSMMKNISETLAGRVSIFEMSSLSNAEILHKANGVFNPDISALKKKKSNNQNISDIYNNIFMGGMPKIVSSDIDREKYYMDYVNTYLEKDIMGYANIGKLREFSNFLICMAGRTGQELNYKDISDNVGVSQVTIKEWVSILEQSGIIFLLYPYFNNVSKRVIKRPKFYFLDTGLCAYLCRWPSAEIIETGSMDGAFLETYVVSEIVKSYLNAGKKPDLYFYRDIDKREVDLLIMKDRSCYPIEIKKSKNPVHIEKNFDAIRKINIDVKTGLIICLVDDLIPYDRNVYLCPVDLI